MHGSFHSRQECTGHGYHAEELAEKRWRFLVAKTSSASEDTGTDQTKVLGRVVEKKDGTHVAVFRPEALNSNSVETPTFRSLEVYKDYPGATLTAHASIEAFRDSGHG